jgi:PHD/YefM family antitoxin component YafN of YafNO toxin-antitoxin module
MATKAKRQKPDIIRVNIGEANACLDRVIEHVQAGDKYAVLEKDGNPVAVVMDIDEFEDYLELQDPEVRKIIAESNRDYLAGRFRPADEFFKELEEEERTEREKASRG